MMRETAVERGNLRDQCQRINEMLTQGHVFLDDLMGSEPETAKVPGPTQSQGVMQELEIALDRIDRTARDLVLRLEALCKHFFDVKEE